MFYIWYKMTSHLRKDIKSTECWDIWIHLREKETEGERVKGIDKKRDGMLKENCQKYCRLKFRQIRETEKCWEKKRKSEIWVEKWNFQFENVQKSQVSRYLFYYIWSKGIERDRQMVRGREGDKKRWNLWENLGASKYLLKS